MSFRKLRPLLMLIAIAGLLSSPALAQSYGVGLSYGVGTDLSDGFDSGSIDDRLLEASFLVEIEPSVLLRARIARRNLDRDDEPNAKIEQLTVDVEYQFDESYYRAGFFVGGGLYRVKPDGAERPSWNDGDDHFGFYGGVNGWFGIRENLWAVPEIRVDRVNDADSRTLASVSASIVWRF